MLWCLWNHFLAISCHLLGLVCYLNACYPIPNKELFTIQSDSILVWDTHFSQSNQFLMDETLSHMFFSCWTYCFTQKYVTLRKQNGCEQPFTWTLKCFFSVPRPVLFLSIWQQYRQIVRSREKESCWVIYQLKWSLELMTKNEREGKSEWGEKRNSLHCLPVCPPQQSESHLSKLQEEIQQCSAALATRDDL